MEERSSVRFVMRQLQVHRMHIQYSTVQRTMHTQEPEPASIPIAGSDKMCEICGFDGGTNENDTVEPSRTDHS